MSGSATASAVTPGVPESGPASGTTPVASTESAAPADFSPAPVVAAPVEPISAPETDPEAAAPEPKPSILSEATADKPEEAPTEAKPEVEVKPDAEAKPAEPAVVVPPVYEPFKLPENVKFDDAKLGTFTGLLGEFETKITSDPAQAHVAAQEFGQKLLDLYITETQAATERQAQAHVENWSRVQDEWQGQFREDPEIGKNRAETSLTRMGGLMDMYGQSAGPERLQQLRSVLSLTGAGNNVEVLRFVNWAASRLVERSRVVAAPTAKAPMPGSKATRLYRNSIPNGAA